jgi:hypothetical protein
MNYLIKFHENHSFSVKKLQNSNIIKGVFSSDPKPLPKEIVYDAMDGDMSLPKRVDLIDGEHDADQGYIDIPGNSLVEVDNRQVFKWIELTKVFDIKITIYNLNMICDLS